MPRLGKFGPAKEAQIKRAIASTSIDKMLAVFAHPGGTAESIHPCLTSQQRDTAIRREFELVYRLHLSPAIQKQHRAVSTLLQLRAASINANPTRQP
jgi:hypothetical protein